MNKKVFLGLLLGCLLSGCGSGKQVATATPTPDIAQGGALAGSPGIGYYPFPSGIEVLDITNEAWAGTPLAVPTDGTVLFGTPTLNASGNMLYTSTYSPKMKGQLSVWNLSSSGSALLGSQDIGTLSSHEEPLIVIPLQDSNVLVGFPATLTGKRMQYTVFTKDLVAVVLPRIETPSAFLSGVADPLPNSGDVWVVTSDGFIVNLLPPSYALPLTKGYPDATFEPFLVSKDGKALYVPRNYDNEQATDIMLVDPKTYNDKVLATTRDFTSEPVDLENGKILVMPTGTAQKFGIIDVASGNLATFDFPDGVPNKPDTALLSPDGTIAILGINVNGPRASEKTGTTMWFLSTTTGQIMKVINDLPIESGLGKQLLIGAGVHS